MIVKLCVIFLENLRLKLCYTPSSDRRDPISDYTITASAAKQQVSQVSSKCHEAAHNKYRRDWMEGVNREYHFITVQIVSCKSDEKSIISL